MAPTTTKSRRDTGGSPAGSSESPPSRRLRRRLRQVVLALGIVVVVLIGGGAVWFLVGRDEARQLTSDEALEDFRASTDPNTTAAGPAGGGLAEQAPDAGQDGSRPAAGVYAATVSGTESVGIPGLDETLGPNAPVTVTHGEPGCFTYRVDFNSHHWRTWTFCPVSDADFALTNAVSATERKFPGLDFGSVNTFTCQQQPAYLWPDQAPGERREGSCTGTSDTIAGTTTDAATVEVLARSTIAVGGPDAAVVHLRTTDTFGEAQSGTEIDEWWIDDRTGLPLKLVFDVNTKSDTPVGPADYVDRGTLELTSLEPAT